jgi:hypothetical protein
MTIQIISPALIIKWHVIYMIATQYLILKTVFDIVNIWLNSEESALERFQIVRLLFNAVPLWKLFHRRRQKH